MDFAREHGATILVFEHLGKLKPVKGRYSKRSNEKWAYWLKGRIVKYARYKAWEDSILTCQVCPAFTSQDCSVCGHRPVARYAEGEAPLAYRPGGPLFLCPTCFKRGHADRNASINIGFRFLIRSLEHSFLKPLSKDKGVGSIQVRPQKPQNQNGRPNGLALPPWYSSLNCASLVVVTPQGLARASTQEYPKKLPSFRTRRVSQNGTGGHSVYPDDSYQ